MNLGLLGAAVVMGIAAVGSAFGIGFAGQAAIGAWKRCYMNNKKAPFILTVFAGAPLTQTIYGFLLMNSLKAKAFENPENGLLYLGIGIFSGLAMCFSAIFQGKAGAAGSDALGETGKGFANYIMVVGLCETVALFAMAFSFGV
ncbi:MAG: V-type ATP synthase subunit K [Treponemataceae bacterium]|nr:V-type ATP synthase subunit K [Treponemataceae bacterium]